MIKLTNIKYTPLAQPKPVSATQEQIREKVATGSNIIHRTQAINAKRPYQTIEEERAVRQRILGEQIKIWRKKLPSHSKNYSVRPEERTQGASRRVNGNRANYILQQLIHITAHFPEKKYLNIVYLLIYI